MPAWDGRAHGDKYLDEEDGAGSYSASGSQSIDYHVFTEHWRTFLKFFKKSFRPHPATVRSVRNPLFRKCPIHLPGHLLPGKPVDVIQPEHDPHLTLWDGLDILLRLTG